MFYWSLIVINLAKEKCGIDKQETHILYYYVKSISFFSIEGLASILIPICTPSKVYKKFLCVTLNNEMVWQKGSSHFLGQIETNDWKFLCFCFNFWFSSRQVLWYYKCPFLWCWIYCQAFQIRETIDYIRYKK